MVIEQICNYPWQIICGASALIGGVGVGVYTYYDKIKQDKDTKFDVKKILDTVWQSAAVGYASSFATGCGYLGILTAIVSAVGVDKLANKFHIKGNQIMNIVQFLSKILKKKVK